MTKISTWSEIHCRNSHNDNKKRTHTNWRSKVLLFIYTACWDFAVWQSQTAHFHSELELRANIVPSASKALKQLKLFVFEAFSFKQTYNRKHSLVFRKLCVPRVFRTLYRNTLIHAWWQICFPQFR